MSSKYLTSSRAWRRRNLTTLSVVEAWTSQFPCQTGTSMAVPTSRYSYHRRPWRDSEILVIKCSQHRSHNHS